MAQLTGAALLAYPLVLHICLSTGYLSIAAYYLSVTLLLPLITSLTARRKASPIDWLCVLLAVALLTVLSSHELLVFKLLPVTIHAAMFGLFAGSLREGGTAFITRIAAAMRPELGAAEVAYTRRVTRAWATFFLVMGIVSALLAVFASDATWSWFVNVFSYVLVALFFVVEFAYRRRLLGELVDYGFTDFLLSLARTDVRGLFWYS